MKHSLRNSLVAVGIGVAWGLVAVCWGDVQRAPETLQSLATKADTIVHGTCVGKEVGLANRLIFTTYKIKVQEPLKGKGVNSGDTMSLTLPGGSFSTPPVSQAALGMPAIVQDEEVVLFLKNPDPSTVKKATVPQLASSPQLVGWWQGKFTVFTDPADGRKKVTRINPERYGFIPRDDVLSTILRALANGELQTSDTSNLVDAGGGLKTTPEGLEMLNRAVKISQGDQAASKAHAQKGPQQRNPVPAQTLDEFKASIRKCAQ
ncbi:MAG: hypothetical protein KatS3mg130_1630 [Candidatus Sumerlaea sp.]|nr:hypothetical protein [Candidatus Sumerlaea chitinivorans]GIX45222.1 MAG: hypothetical protein KatS3mg130_1630 [Candidatus Sumerlaea sp.]